MANVTWHGHIQLGLEIMQGIEVFDAVPMNHIIQKAVFKCSMCVASFFLLYINTKFLL